MSKKPAFTSRTARTYEKVRDAIVQAKFIPGEHLKIDVLCAEFEAASGAVREALSRLTAEGLVKSIPQKGFEVAPISKKDLIELTEVRVEVEARCLEEAIRHGTEDWESSVLSARHRLNAITDARCKPLTDAGAEWHKRHMAFHDALVSACPNEVWLQIRESLYMRSERYRRISAPVEQRDRPIEEEHNQIADAALAHDAEAAKLAMKRHLEKTTEILLKSQIPFKEYEIEEASKAS